jgi:hypothetical protein
MSRRGRHASGAGLPLEESGQPGEDRGLELSAGDGRCDDVLGDTGPATQIPRIELGEAGQSLALRSGEPIGRRRRQLCRFPLVSSRPRCVAALHLRPSGPRLRDFPDRRLACIEAPATYKDLQPLLGRRIKAAVIREHWAEVRRLASMRAAADEMPSSCPASA